MLTIFFYCAFVIFFLITDLYFLIPAVITQTFNPVAAISPLALAIQIGIPTKEAKSENETDSMIAETKISDCSM